MFRREEHRAVLQVLAGLDADLLAGHRALFGGGTRLVLDLGEYRISRDVDFLCSDPRSYAELRSRARERGPGGLFRDRGGGLELPREARADQYGVRFPVVVAGLSIKLEIVREGRIELGPGLRPGWSPVDCLSLVDSSAEKLLANSDRWTDRQFLGRDLIDLAVLCHRRGRLPQEAWRKAEAAYGPAVRQDLRRALRDFLDDPAWRRRCFDGLEIAAPADIEAGAEALQDELSSDLSGPSAPEQP